MSVVTDKLCPKLDNLHINNQTEDKENRVQFNGILNGRVVRYFVKMFPPFFALLSQERLVGFQLFCFQALPCIISILSILLTSVVCVSCIYSCLKFEYHAFVQVLHFTVSYCCFFVREASISFFIIYPAVYSNF